MNQDIADNVLEKGREGIKENLLGALSDFMDEYVEEMWTLVNELIRLRTENKALREKKSPEKPVSLIEYTRIKDELRSKVDYIHEQDEIIKEYKDKIESRGLVEVPKGAVVLTPEERAEEMRLANEERKQAVKDFSHKVLSVSKITFSTLTEPRIELSLAEYKQLVREACGE